VALTAQLLVDLPDAVDRGCVEDLLHERLELLVAHRRADGGRVLAA
jgi:predicted RNA-binding protein YlqC (UPF0109 family)